MESTGRLIAALAASLLAGVRPRVILALVAAILAVIIVRSGLLEIKPALATFTGALASLLAQCFLESVVGSVVIIAGVVYYALITRRKSIGQK